MFAFFSLLFALHPGDLAFAPRPEISVREEAYHAAALTELAPSALLDSERIFSPAAHAPEWLASKGTSVPIFTAYRPEEWISTIAHEFHAEDTHLTHAALFLARMPVQVNMTPRRVYLTLRVGTF